MAVRRDITSADHVFLGTDVNLEFTIYTDATLSTIEDMTGKSLRFVVRKFVSDADPAVLDKSSTESPPGISITGTFNADPAVNTQAVIVHLADTDTYDPTVSPVVGIESGGYWYSLKGMDPGVETVFSFGAFQLGQVTAR